MNRGTLNAYPINGNIYLQLSMGAVVVVNSTLPIIYGVTLGGSASVVHQASGSLYKQSYVSAGANTVVESELISSAVPAAMGEGQASIVVAADGSPITRFHPSMSAEVILQSSVDSSAVPAAMGEGTLNVVFESDLIPDVREAPMGQGTATIEVSSVAELMIRLNLSGSSYIELDSGLDATIRPHPPRRSGHAYVRFEPRLAAHIGKSVSVEASPDINVSSDLYANLRMVAGGMAVMELHGSGAARLGAYHYGSGRVTIGMEARGQSEIWRHVHGQGEALIEIQLQAERYGLPTIPTIYTPAHPSWQFQMPRESWEFTVPSDNWGQR